MRYRVLKECVIESKYRAVGDTYCQGKYMPLEALMALIDNGFIEKAKDKAWEPKATIYSKLAGVEIALEDYVEEDGNKYFTYDKALEIEKKLKGTGWRLPTRHEWALIAEEFGNDDDGKLNGNKLAKRLNLQKNGLIYSGNVNYLNSGGYYWSRTGNNASNAYILYFGTDGNLDTGIYYRYRGGSVRLVRDIADKK